MELRKLCCHAYMLEGVEPVKEPANADEGLRYICLLPFALAAQIWLLFSCGDMKCDACMIKEQFKRN